MIHPGALPPPSPGPMNARAALPERRERAAGSRVQVLCAWVSVCSSPVSYPLFEREEMLSLPTNKERRFTLLERFWLQLAGYLMDRWGFYCLSLCLYEWLVEDWQAAFFVRVCVACDTAQRLRRVRVSRMLTGKRREERRGFLSFHIVCFSRTWRRSCCCILWGSC